MQLPPLQPIANVEPFVSGDVKIDPSAAIASGVILQAAANCQIIIAAGVCIGMGVIVHAYQGNIEIASGATIGSGVLLVGKIKIGANACVGALATVIEKDIELEQVILPASIIGNSGRNILENSTTSPPNQEFAQTPLSSNETEENNHSSNSASANNFSYPEETQPETEKPNTQLHTEASPEETQTETEKSNTQLQPANNFSYPEETQTETEKSNTQLQPEASPEETQTETEKSNTQLQPEASPNINPQIYGKEYVSQIMKTLFPYKKSLSPAPDEED